MQRNTEHKEHVQEIMTWVYWTTGKPREWDFGPIPWACAGQPSEKQIEIYYLHNRVEGKSSEGSAVKSNDTDKERQTSQLLSLTRELGTTDQGKDLEDSLSARASRLVGDKRSVNYISKRRKYNKIDLNALASTGYYIWISGIAWIKDFQNPFI